MALHRFRVAKTEEERQAAVKYAQEYCAKYKLNYKRQFSHLYWVTIYIIYKRGKKNMTQEVKVLENEVTLMGKTFNVYGRATV